MAGITIPYNEYQNMLELIQSQKQKLFELESNQRKVLMVVENHNFEHVKGTKAVDVIVNDVKYINLEDVKQIYHQQIHKEMHSSFQKQLATQQEQIDSLAKQLESKIQLVDKLSKEVADLRIDNHNISQQSVEKEEYFKKQIRTNNEQFKFELNKRENDYKNEIYKQSIIIDKDSTIQNLQSEINTLKAQTELLNTMYNQTLNELNIQKTKRIWFQNIFKK